MKEKMLQALEEGIPDDMKLGYILIIARVESEKAVKKVKKEHGIEEEEKEEGGGGERIDTYGNII